MPRRPLALVVSLLVLALVGCAPTTVLPPAGAPSDEAPLFASDEEALAAATAAYEEFLAALDAKLQDPPSPAISLDEFAEKQALDEAIQSVEQFEVEGFQITAPRTVTSARLQMVIRVEGATEVVFYACESVAGVDLLDDAGESLVAPERPDLSAWESSVVFRPGQTLVNSRTQWTGGDVC